MTHKCRTGTVPGSDYGPGTLSPLGRDSRARWTARVEWARRKGWITALHAMVALALLKRLTRLGVCEVTHAMLAGDVQCSVSTVQRCLRELKAQKLVTWENRVIRVRDHRGVALRQQAPNWYQLIVSESYRAPDSKPKAVKIKGSQADRVTNKNQEIDITKSQLSLWIKLQIPVHQGLKPPGWFLDGIVRQDLGMPALSS